MIPLDSQIVNKEEPFDQVRELLQEHEFTLGGNWEYDHGYFDKHLDEERKVWLRIPIQVTRGVLDGDTVSTDAIVAVGTPFVLKHLYNEGLDRGAEMHTVGALIDQFQEPVDKDAPVEDRWVAMARQVLADVEKDWLQ